MAIITLTTDFGLKDPYVGAVKGAIYSELPEAHVVDISHMVTPFHIVEASYILKNSYYSFPKGTVHVIGVDAESTQENPHVAVLLDDHYFICADNGVLCMLTSRFRPTKIVQINIHDRFISNFPVLDVFVKTACHLARGGTMEVVGRSIPELQNHQRTQPLINEQQRMVVGSVIYIDNYGNAVTNITREIFDTVGKGKPFELDARGNKFKTVYESYSDLVDFSTEQPRRDNEGKKLAVFNSAGHIELATYKSNPLSVGSARDLFGLRLETTVTLKFAEE